jgi:hypothetical protein
MKEEMAEAPELVTRLEELATELGFSRPKNLPRDGDHIAINQLAVFGKLLVVLTRYMDRAQKTIKRLTWVLTVLTAILALDAIVRIFIH